MNTLEKLKSLEALSDAKLDKLATQAIEEGRKRAEAPMSRGEREEQLIGFVCGNQDEGPTRSREEIRKNLNRWPPL